MTSREFEKQYKGLNLAQKEAVDTIEGAIMVVAGPGTGKTKTLTLRIANILLKTQVNAENILALTFTEAAAHEMRKRLLSIIGHDAYRVDITTFHSFCNSFIKTHQEEFAHIISSENINEIDQLEIVEGAINDLPLKILKPLGDLTYYVQPAMRMIGNLKQENITPEGFEKGLKDFEKDLKDRPDLLHEKGAHKGKMKSQYKKQFDNLEKSKELLLVYKEYQKRLFKGKKYDYNDMLLEVIKKLEEHEYLLQYLQEKFHYLLVDEHQDTNASQNKIVELISNYFENPNLFIVGDEKQAIFRFQGATIANFYKFKEKYPDARLINLSDNYRSTKNILDSSFSLISNNPKHSKILAESHALKKNVGYSEEKIHIASLSTSTSEVYFVTEKIKELLKSAKGHEIAVLVRNNRDVESFIPVFENEKIPYIVEADNDILDDLDVQKLVLLLKTVAKQTNENVQRALLLDCFKISPLDVFKINRLSYDKKVPVWDVLTNNNWLDEIEILNKKPIEQFVKLFMGEDGFVKQSVNSRFDVLFVDVLNKSGLMTTILKKPHGQEILLRVTRLYDEIKKQVARNPLYTVTDFIKFIDLLKTHKISLKLNTSIIPEDLVRVMTVHKSKGLEFDNVFIVNCYDTHWGNKHNIGSKFEIPWEYLVGTRESDEEMDKNADERRLFYVAMTRARKKIFITYSMTSMDGREQIPSQFISEIPEEFIFEENIVNFEKKLSSNLEAILVSSKSEKGQLISSKYAKELFRRQGLSVSALNNYLTCPWKFFFVNLIRLPQKIENSNLYGSAIHGALNQYLVQLKKGKKVTKELLIEKFREEMDILPFSENERDRFMERGKEALSGFYDNQMTDWESDMETELEIKGIRINDDLILNGKIDMIRPVDGGKFDVTDFKTGKPKSRNVIEGNVKDGDGNYKRQLVFYKILLDRFRNGFFKMNNGIIEFVEPTEKGDYRREVFDITDEEEKILLEQTVKVGEEISSLSFWNDTCKDLDCEYCKLRNFIN